MGKSLEIWRARIGTYCQTKKPYRLELLKNNNLSLCIRLCLFFPLVAQCVETNLGSSSEDQGSRSRTGSLSRGRGHTSVASRETTEHQIIISQPIAYQLRSGTHTKQVKSQPSLSSWLQPLEIATKENY